MKKKATCQVIFASVFMLVSINPAIKYTKEKTGVKGKDLFMTIRAALTGKVHGPELDKVFAVLGKDTALKRLRSFSD